MVIPDSAIYGSIATLGLMLLGLVGYLHKDMKAGITKLADLLMPLQRTVDKHEMKLDEHDKLHGKHAEEIEELKKNTLNLHTRIVKIEDRK